MTFSYSLSLQQFLSVPDNFITGSSTLIKDKAAMAILAKSKDEIGEMMGHSTARSQNFTWRAWIWIKHGELTKGSQICQII